MRELLLLSIGVLFAFNVESQVVEKKSVDPYLLKGLPQESVYKVPLHRADITSLPFFDGFESNTSWDFWTILNSSDVVEGAFINLVTTYMGSDYTYQGDRCVCFSSYNESQHYDQYIVTSKLDLGENEKPMKASLYYRKYVYGESEQFRVGYSIDDEFKLENCVWGDTINATSVEYQLLEHALPANAKHFVVHYFSKYSYYLFVDNVTIDYATSIDNTSWTDIRIFPSPAIDVVNIQGENISDVILLDITGKQIMAKINLQTSFVSLDTSRLPAGIYLVKIIEKNGNVTTRKIGITI